MDKMRITTLLRNNGCITVNKYLIQSLGLNEAVLFCELCSRHEYFEDREMLDKDGYFYNTQYDLQAGTGLGEKAQRTAINNLKKMKLVEVKIKGIPAKRHFKIIASDETMLFYLQEGKKKLKSLENSSDTSVGGNLKLRRKELDTAEGSANNTNNNPKHNTKYYIIGDDAILDLFVGQYRDAFSEPYRRITLDAVENFKDRTSIYDFEELAEIIEDFFEENKDHQERCTIEYFASILDRYR